MPQQDGVLERWCVCVKGCVCVWFPRCSWPAGAVCCSSSCSLPLLSPSSSQGGCFLREGSYTSTSMVHHSWFVSSSYAPNPANRSAAGTVTMGRLVRGVAWTCLMRGRALLMRSAAAIPAAAPSPRPAQPPAAPALPPAASQPSGRRAPSPRGARAASSRRRRALATARPAAAAGSALGQAVLVGEEASE